MIVSQSDRYMLGSLHGFDTGNMGCTTGNHLDSITTLLLGHSLVCVKSMWYQAGVENAITQVYKWMDVQTDLETQV